MTGKHLGLAFVLLFLLCPAAVVQAVEMVSVDRPEINMRSGPGIHYPVLWELGQGYPLMVVGRQGNWLKVKDFENDEGWVYRPLVGHTPHVVPKVASLNIRRGPGTRFQAVGRGKYGEVLRTLKRARGWVKVRREDGLTGWVSRRLVWGW